MISNDLSFGVWLKQRRKAADLTQDALAELAGCSTDMVRKIEGDVARPSRKLTELLLTALDFSPQEQPALMTWARTGLPPLQEASSPTPGRVVIPNGSTSRLENPSNPYKGLRAFQE